MSSSTARRPNAEKLRDALPNAELIEAVNGRDPDQISHIRLYPGNLHKPHYPFDLRPAEIGVFQSHRRCWQSLLDSGAPFALIAEDDLAVDPPRLEQAMALISDYATPDMYVRLPVKAREVPGTVLASDGEIRLILPKIIGLQCICQVVGRVAAARLLAATDQIDRPVDTLLQMHWVTGQKVHSLLPNGNQEIAGQIGGSTIQKKTHASGKLTREIKRAIYRAQLHLHPQKP